MQLNMLNDLAEATKALYGKKKDSQSLHREQDWLSMQKEHKGLG